MCGIVGFLAKRPELRDQLGAYTSPMLDAMATRGPDSAGFAVFGEAQDELWRINLFALTPDYDWRPLTDALAHAEGPSGEVRSLGRHGILVTPDPPARARTWLHHHHPELVELSTGRAMDVFKDVGHPRAVAEQYGLEAMQGTHAVAHTRMATESAVTPLHAHPFVAGDDFCLVHNGSLSNPNSLRRKLERKGVGFLTDNDTEAAARLIQWRLSEGDDLHAALEYGFGEMDGFYTLLMANDHELALVRDSFACKPAVAAETDDYVAVASEFHSLARLPGIADAEIFEPAPEEIYVWQV
ncbi:amidophosphoribosyltransferase [Thiohalorhabdus methylotrophus]|uniref:glutamine--fructose-6-phosphate transaminase (isomerizing) n=1 Tax=Thiohalorhabdus methylotrophus TaxID=3242694 RepID=A0ABV4TW85_9GAMM